MNEEQLQAIVFDPALGAWTVSRYADVAAALRDPRLRVGGSMPAPAHEAAYAAARTATSRALSPARAAAWCPAFTSAAQCLVRTLPVEQRVDLVRDFAMPWALHVAATVTEMSLADAAGLAGLAHTVFAAAAEATDAVVPPAAAAATLALARALQATARWPDVQAFVALSQTLPSVLAGAWRALLDQPAALCAVRHGLRAAPTLAPGVIEELLRHAGPARAVFRQATADVPIGPACIVAGDRVILRLAAANNDPARFPIPERLDVARATAGHLAFGGGRYSCPGAPVIRLALAVATGALLEGTGDIVRLAGETSGDGFAIRGPGSLPVRLSRVPGDAP